MPTDARRWWTLAAMVGALALVVTDASAVGVALPHVQRRFGLDQGTLQWVVNAYVLTFAAVLAVAARVGDRYGRVRAFVAGVVLFAAGSAACAAAPNAAVLLAGRAVGAVGSALMQPASAVLVTEAFPLRQRGRATAVYSAGSLQFLVIGPLVGGVLVQFVGWRAVFVVNLPLAAVVLGLVAVARPADHLAARPPLPVRSAVLLAAGTTALVLGLQESHRWGWSSPQTLGTVGGGVVVLALFAAVGRREADPLLDLRLLRDRGFAADAAALFCTQFALVGQAAFLPIYLQKVLHFAPAAAGVAMLAQVLPLAVASPLGGGLFDRRGVKAPAVLGLGLAALGFAAEAVAFPHREFAWAAVGMALVGTGLGLVLPPAYTDGMSRVPAEHRGRAYALLSTLRQFGGAVGMAAVGSLVAGLELDRLGPLADRHAAGAAERVELQDLLLAASRGSADAARTIGDRWPAALDELKQSGAESIAAGDALSAVVLVVGFVVAVFLMRSGRLIPEETEAADPARSETHSTG